MREGGGAVPDELDQDYLRRLASTQPRNLPPELDLFDEETSRSGLRLNKAAYSLKHPEQRELFERDERAWMDQFGLTDDERRLIAGRDWIELWRRGMSIYTMIKLIGVTGTPLVEIGKQMRERGTREMSAHAGSGAPAPGGPATTTSEEA
jgi:protocatechuate 4,5-dioxygenase alpha subunit